MKTKLYGFVAGFMLLASIMPAYAAQDAVLSFSPATNTVCVNTDVTVTIRLNTGTNTNVTTVTPYFNYDPSFFALQGQISVPSSGPFPVVFRNNPTASGLVELSMSNLTPQGGASLAVASFVLRPLKTGTTTLSFDTNKSAVLLADATNTNVLLNAQALNLTINTSCTSSSSGGSSSGGSSSGGSSSSGSGSSSGTGSSGGGGGGNTRFTHLACVNSQCVSVAGTGSDECSSVGSSCTGSGSGGGSSSGTGSSSGSGSGSGAGIAEDPQCTRPTNVRAEARDGSINILWEDTDPRVTAFEVLYGTESGNYVADEHTANIRSLLLTGLEKGKTYFLAVQALGECNASSLSDEVSVQAQSGSVATGTGRPAAGGTKSPTKLPPKNTAAGAAVAIPLVVMGLGGLGYIVRKKKIGL